MRLSKAHIEYVSFLVYKALQQSPGISLRNPDAVVRIVHGVLAENLRQEAELEKEAEAMLRTHRADILKTDADYARMIRDGARALARQRGIPL